MPLFKKESSLLIRILIVLTAITVGFCLVSYTISRQFLKNAIWSEFSNSSDRILRSIARQSVNDIKYADYFQIQRTLQDFYDTSYMRYLAIYTADAQLLAMFPKQIGGEEYMFMEQNARKHSNLAFAQEFMRHGGESLFHFQATIQDENGVSLGYVVMGGTTAPLEKVVRTQTIFFALFAFVALCIQIGAIVYFSYTLTRPLRRLTDLMRGMEGNEPEKFLPVLLKQRPPTTASSEVHLFYNVYQKLLQNIHVHQMHERGMAIQASIGTIASHIAHDMRSPLSVIKGFVGMVATDKGSDFEDFKGAALRSVEKLNRMADDLVDYARAKQIQPAPVDMVRLLHDVAGEFTSTLVDKGAALSVDCPAPLHVRLDAPKFDRVLANLIQNAIHAIPPMIGSIRVSAHMTKQGWLSIAVADNGCGIDPNHLPHLFDSSFTFGKPSGTGLGLSYCKNVIEAHGGRISVESTVDHGSRFHIEVPQATIPSPRVMEQGTAPALAAPIPESARTILVVDDDPDIILQWKRLITANTPFDVASVAGPDEALALETNPGRFRAAIVDYHFEGKEKNGLDLIRALKSRQIPRLYLCTGFYYDPSLQQEAIAAGVQAIIPKPIPEGLVKQLLGS